jgi:hypothetical protein
MRMQNNRPATCCPHCFVSMRFARSIPQSDGLSDLQTFECDLCGLAITGEAVAEVMEMAARCEAA